MAVTNIPIGDPKAAKRWSGSLFIETTKKSYFNRKFVATYDNAVIQQLTDLEQNAGDKIGFDLSVQLRQKPTSGDNRLQGKEENLKFFSDEVQIDQLRHGVSAGGKMSRKRTVHNIRKFARDRLSDYWSKYLDEMRFSYLSGARYQQGLHRRLGLCRPCGQSYSGRRQRPYSFWRHGNIEGQCESD